MIATCSSTALEPRRIQRSCAPYTARNESCYYWCLAGDSIRINVTLDSEHAEKLSRMAEQAYTQEGTLARSLLSRAIDEADIDAASMVELLNGIPGALERAQLGREQARTGETIRLDDL